MLTAPYFTLVILSFSLIFSHSHPLILSFSWIIKRNTKNIFVRFKYHQLLKYYFKLDKVFSLVELLFNHYNCVAMTIHHFAFIFKFSNKTNHVFLLFVSAGTFSWFTLLEIWRIVWNSNKKGIKENHWKAVKLPLNLTPPAVEKREWSRGENVANGEKRRKERKANRKKKTSILSFPTSSAEPLSCHMLASRNVLAAAGFMSVQRTAALFCNGAASGCSSPPQIPRLVSSPAKTASFLHASWTSVSYEMKGGGEMNLPHSVQRFVGSSCTSACESEWVGRDPKAADSILFPPNWHCHSFLHQMASAWQSVLSAHQRIVDNGGMMLMITFRSLQ